MDLTSLSCSRAFATAISISASLLLLSACGGGSSPAAAASDDPPTDASSRESASALDVGATWTTLAGEGSSFRVQGLRSVRYGADSRWVEKKVSGTVPCTSAFFGRDPAPGARKRCEAQATTVAASGTAATASSRRRDPLKQPFAVNSIWNMPLGSDARYVHARLDVTPRNDPWAPMPMAERDHIVLAPTAPMVEVHHSRGGWSGRDRCVPSGTKVLQRVPIPYDYVVPNARTNDSAAFLMPDRRTVMQSQPLARCRKGGIATGWVGFEKTDLYGDGIVGSHGGSRMSALGGTIRLGELRPGQQGPAHALKLVVDAATMLAPCSTKAACFRWPARGADSYATRVYGRKGTTVPSGMKMGALLALHRDLNIASLGLETEPGRQLAWTLQNYGAYIVDDTYGAGVSIAVEVGPDGRLEDQFRRDYGYRFEARVRDGSPWVRDMQRLVGALHLIDNNAPSRIGGGGTPRQPLAAPLE